MSMINDCVSKEILLLHAVAEMHIGNGDREERDGHDGPKNILHGQTPVAGKALFDSPTRKGGINSS